MSGASNFSTFQASDDESSRPKDGQSYQMQQYLQADPTITERVAQASNLVRAKKESKKHGTKGSVKELKERLADLEKVINRDSSSAA